jgi:hypothetical protein
MFIIASKFRPGHALSFLTLPQKNTKIFITLLQLTYCNDGGKFSAFLQLELISHHNYRNALQASKTT